MTQQTELEYLKTEVKELKERLLNLERIFKCRIIAEQSNEAIPSVNYIDSYFVGYRTEQGERLQLTEQKR